MSFARALRDASANSSGPRGSTTAPEQATLFGTSAAAVFGMNPAFDLVTEAQVRARTIEDALQPEELLMARHQLPPWPQVETVNLASLVVDGDRLPYPQWRLLSEGPILDTPGMRFAESPFDDPYNSYTRNVMPQAKAGDRWWNEPLEQTDPAYWLFAG